jgi:hypothetical protein
VPNRCELFGCSSAHTLRWRIGRDEVWMIALEILKLVNERIELGVGKFGVLMNVVPLFEVTDLAAKLCYTGCWIQGAGGTESGN